MRKTSKYSTTIMILLASASVLFLNTNSAFAEGESSESNEKSLPPIVMVVFDTSGSMDIIVEKYRSNGTTYNYSNTGNDRASNTGNYNSGIHNSASHTRLTKAIAEIAGTPKKPNGVGYNRLIKAYNAVFPRSVYHCDSSHCWYTLSAYTPSTSTDYGVSKLVVNSSCTDNLLSTYTSSLATCSLAEFQNAYMNDGVLQGYQNSVKFGFAGMASTSTSDNKYWLRIPYNGCEADNACDCVTPYSDNSLYNTCN